MKIIGTKVHGYLDYAIGILFLFIPSVLKLESHTAQSLLFYIYGIFIIFLSIHTDYRAGLYKLLSLDVHIFIEIIASLFFMLSPWIFGFSAKIYLPHIFFGGVIIIMSIGTIMNRKSFVD